MLNHIKNITKNDQTGSIGVIEILLVIVLIGASTFVAWRLSNASDSEQNSQLAIDQARESQEIGLSKLILVEDIEQQKEEDLAKSADKKKDDLPEETVTQKEPEEENKNEEKPKITYLEMTSVNTGISGTTVSATASLKQANTGTCNLKFRKDGKTKVYFERQISNSKECSFTVDTSEINLSGVIEVYMWFSSQNNGAKGWADQASIKL